MSKPWLPTPSSRPAAHSPPLGPMLAGARARGVADGLEWLGLVAILIDDRGEALHVNLGAIELMGDSLYLEAGRLRAADAFADSALAEAICAVLERGVAAATRVPMREGVLHVHVAAMGAGDDDPYQLLRAVVLLRRAGPDRSQH